MSTPSRPVWGTLQDASAHLKISPWTVRRMVARGELPGRKFGGQIRVDLSRLDEAGSSLVWDARATA